MRSEEELVERLLEAADAVENEDEDARDELYKAISAALEVWAPETLERAQAGEVASVQPKPPGAGEGTRLPGPRLAFLRSVAYGILLLSLNRPRDLHDVGILLAGVTRPALTLGQKLLYPIDNRAGKRQEFGRTR
jgi:hypothetical protein